MKIGIIGAGSFGTQHAEAISALDNLQLVAACRTNEVALREFVQRYGGTPYTNHQDLLKDTSIDAVVIATPHHLHTPIVEAAAQAGKHILLEKPMAPNLAECDQILHVAKHCNITLMVGFVNHFIPVYQQAKQIIESGKLGEVVLGVSTMSKFWFESNRRDWHLDRTIGGGMWLTAGIHCLDRMTWLIDSHVRQVSAQFDTRLHDQQADDTGMIFLRYANGVAGTVLSVGYTDGAPKHLTELTCTKGMMNIDYTNGITIGRNGIWETLTPLPQDNWMHQGLVSEWRAFVNAVKQDTIPAVSGEYARHIMSTVFAAEESSRTQREVVVPR